MFSFKLKTHNLNATYSEPHFFILNKGNHSGKPMNDPCPNCFVCICSSEEEKEMLYWLVMGLCQGRVFEQYLCGSVIPFVRINDVKKALNSGFHSIILQNQFSIKRKLSPFRRCSRPRILYCNSCKVCKVCKKCWFQI